jgi:hypothetical protein
MREAWLQSHHRTNTPTITAVRAEFQIGNPSTLWALYRKMKLSKVNLYIIQGCESEREVNNQYSPIYI